MANRFFVRGETPDGIESSDWFQTDGYMNGSIAEYCHHWALTSGGAPGASIPTTGDVAIFDANSWVDGTLTLSGNFDVYASQPILSAILSTNAAAVLAPSYLSLQADLNWPGNLVISGGTFITNNYAVNVGSLLWLVGSYNVNYGTSIITINGGSNPNGAAGYYDYDYGMGTLSATASTIILKATGVPVVFANGGRQGGSSNVQGANYGNLQINISAGGNAVQIEGSTSFNTLAITGNGAVTFSDAYYVYTQTVRQASGMSFAGVTPGGLFLIGWAPQGWGLSMPSGVATATNCTIQACTATGGATFKASTSNGNVDDGGNTGWDFTSSTYVHNPLCITPAMTANNAPSPVVITASNTDGYQVFDQINDYWLFGGSTGYLQVYLGSGHGKKITSYTISVVSGAGSQDPKSWTLYGSNNGTVWTPLDSQSNQISWANEEMRTYFLSGTSAQYEYYKLDITENNGDGAHLSVGELELLGVPPILADISDDANVNDSFDGLIDGLSEDITATTDIGGGLAITGSISEDVSAGDEFIAYIPLDVSDSLVLADTQSISWPKSVIESFVLADLIMSPYLETLLDTLFIYDELHHGWKVTAGSSLILVDSIQKILGIIVDEWINLIDIQSNNWNGREVISENVTLYDIAGFGKIYIDSLSDELHIADVSTYKLTITVLEYLGFTELANAMRSSASAINDSISITDNSALAFPKSVESILSIVDLSTVAVQFLNSAQSTLGLADVSSLIKRVSDTVTDPIIFVDTITSHAHLYSLIYDTLAMNVTVELAGEVWECYVLNTPKFHPSMYSGFNFNSYCVFENRAFGANDTGICELTGETDAGSPIHTGVILSETNFNSPNQKRFRRGYIDISGTSPKMILETGEGQRQAYAIDEQGKMVASHELKSKSWILSVADFETLGSMKLIPIILTK